jgi:hypothetical protein
MQRVRESGTPYEALECVATAVGGFDRPLRRVYGITYVSES